MDTKEATMVINIMLYGVRCLDCADVLITCFINTFPEHKGLAERAFKEFKRRCHFDK